MDQNDNNQVSSKKKIAGQFVFAALFFILIIADIILYFCPVTTSFIVTGGLGTALGFGFLFLIFFFLFLFSGIAEAKRYYRYKNGIPNEKPTDEDTPVEVAEYKYDPYNPDNKYWLEDCLDDNKIPYKCEIVAHTYGLGTRIGMPHTYYIKEIYVKKKCEDTVRGFIEQYDTPAETDTK